MGSRRSAFTLIEILIVVGIIAILAAIAAPNFLAAQTRAKVSRARSDLRTVVTALEAYHADHNSYPYHRGGGTGGFGEVEPVHVNSGHGVGRNFGFRTIPIRLSTPTAYLTTTALPDPFKRGALDPTGVGYSTGDPTDEAYVYHNIYQFAILQMTPGFYPDDFHSDYGHWRIFSLGPNGEYDSFGAADRGWSYDPTNGVRSRGNIIRTQVDPEGVHIAVPD